MTAPDDSAPPPGDPAPPADDPVLATVHQWRRQASDLGGRNPLLWYRDLANGSFDLTVAHPGGVAKLLKGADTRLSDLVREQVAFEQARTKVGAIRAKTSEMWRDHGLTTAFIAIGMASWTIRRAPVPPRAPVLLRSCTITPTDAGHTDFTITADDEVVFNPVLAHYLSGELGVPVDGQELVALSSKPGGFDPRPAYQQLEALCAGLENFGIGPQMVVSTFPWAKLPFVADLSAPRLAAAPMVRTLAAPPRQPAALPEDVFAASAGEVALPTDSAQRQVVAAVRAGHSVVVDAAPGTGRTQTVAATVADTLARGGSVLVVAEPSAALDDLHRRLGRIGLADRVLRLRETRAGVRTMVAELNRSLDEAEQPVAGDTGLDADQVRRATADHSAATRAIDDHLDSMHRTREPWDVSLAQVQQRLTELAAGPRPPISQVRLAGSTLEEISLERLEQIEDSLTEAAKVGAWQRGRGDDPWYGARLADDAEATRAGDIVTSLVTGRLEQARAAANSISAAAGLPEPVTVDQWHRNLTLLGRAHATLDVFQPQIYEAPLQEMAQALDRTAPRASAVVRARAKRGARALLRPGAPPADLAAQVREAHEQWAEWEALAGRAARPTAVTGWQEAWEIVEPVREDLTWLTDVLAETPVGPDLLSVHLDTMLERLVRLDARADRLSLAATSHALLEPLRQAGLGPLVDDLAERGVAEPDVTAEVEVVFWSSLLEVMADEGHDGRALREAVEGLDDLESVLRSAVVDEVMRTCQERAEKAVGAKADQVRRLRAGVTVQPELAGPGHPPPLTSVAALAQELRPCWLAAPVVAPAVIPPEAGFDLVIIDEAGRMPLPHALPALARAGQVLALGSHLDSAPQSFRVVVDERAEQQSSTTQQDALSGLQQLFPTLELPIDHQSIDGRLRAALIERGEAVGAGLPGVLRSPRVSASWVDLEALADRVASMVIDHASAASWQSLAVLAPDRRSLQWIENHLRERIGAEGLGRAFRDDAAEALLLATLDGAGLSTRDRVVVAMPADPSLSPAMARAALLLARRSVSVVVAAADQTWPAGEGAELLQRAVALSATEPSDVQVEHSALVDDLARRLRAEGLQVSGDPSEHSAAIDLVIDDPDDPGRPLVAIRTDARQWPDHDRTSLPRRLRRLGWSTEVVWCTDLFRDPAREVARLVHAVRAASAGRSR